MASGDPPGLWISCEHYDLSASALDRCLGSPLAHTVTVDPGGAARGTVVNATCQWMAVGRDDHPMLLVAPGGMMASGVGENEGASERTCTATAEPGGALTRTPRDGSVNTGTWVLRETTYRSHFSSASGRSPTGAISNGRPRSRIMSAFDRSVWPAARMSCLLSAGDPNAATARRNGPTVTCGTYRRSGWKSREGLNPQAQPHPARPAPVTMLWLAGSRVLVSIGAFSHIARPAYATIPTTATPAIPRIQCGDVSGRRSDTQLEINDESSPIASSMNTAAG